jgi:hypothetical protein
MKARFTLALVVSLLLAIALLSGCSKKNSTSSLTAPGSSSGGNTAAYQAQISGVLASTPEVVEDGQFEVADLFSTASATGSVNPLAAITPLRWRRHITHVDRTFEFAFSDSDSTGQPQTAIVTVHKLLTGTFDILGTTVPDTTSNDSTGGGTPKDTLKLIHKPLEDHWVRRILLKHLNMSTRRGTDGDGNDQGENEDGDHGGRNMRWKVAGTSGVEVTSKDATTQIQSLRIQTSSLDTTITDPLVFFRLRRLISVGAMEQVTLTVTTGRNDDNVFLLFHDGHAHFKNNGDGTYSGTWRAPWFAGIKHVGVNALSHGTLYDDAAAYDSKAWIVPYVVKGFSCGDFLPND